MVEPAAAGGAPATDPAGQGPIGDVLVIFGITGDLARVMTFRSLYRLEQRGLLDCPIVGVAGDDWSLPQLVERARTSIDGTGETIDPTVFERLTGRLSYVQGDFTDPATYDKVGEAIEWREVSRLLPRDPAVPLRHGRERAGRSWSHVHRARRRGEAVRPRPDLGPRAGRGAPPVRGRVAAVPDRPLPRQDGARADPLPALREHDARAGLEPQLRRLRPDHDGGGLRGRGPRPLLRSRRCVARRGGQPPAAAAGERPRWRRPPAATRRR